MYSIMLPTVYSYVIYIYCCDLPWIEQSQSRTLGLIAKRIRAHSLPGQRTLTGMQ